MAVPYSAAFLVPMGLIHIVLFMVMTSSSVALPAEEFRSAAVVNACDRRDATSTDHQHDSSSLTRKDKDDQTLKPRDCIREIQDLWIVQTGLSTEFL